MPSQEMILMAKLVTTIYNRSDAEPFRDPVAWKSLGLFDYPQIIKKPMDLGQIRTKIDKENYNSIHDAAEDVRLVWKNCMTYNADGSDFYKLAQSLSKKFEDKYTKLLKELNVESPQKVTSEKTGPAPEPTLEEKRTFAKNLYKISKEELGKIIVDLDNQCPQAITKNAAEDQVEINVDEISPESFQTAMAFVSKCMENGGTKKKKAKKARTS